MAHRDIGGRHLPGYSSLTELTSNTGTAATFLPIIGAIAVSLGENPLLLLIPTALAANCSFMMPVGTPPNAIVFASGQLTLPQMARAGWLLNLLVVPLVVAVVWFLGPWVFRNPDRSAPRLGGSCGALRGIGHQADAAAAGTARRLKGSRLKRASIRSFSSRMIFPGSKASARKPHETQCSMVVKPMHGMSKRMSC